MVSTVLLMEIALLAAAAYAAGIRRGFHEIVIVATRAQRRASPAETHDRASAATRSYPCKSRPRRGRVGSSRRGNGIARGGMPSQKQLWP